MAVNDLTRKSETLDMGYRVKNPGISLSWIFLFVAVLFAGGCAPSIRGQVTEETTASAILIVPRIQFSLGSFTFTMSTAATTSIPANTGGAISNCTVSPALPAGLSISTTDCTISGTPTGTSVLTTYAITPSNESGNGDSVNIDITVQTLSYSISGTLILSNYAGDPTEVQVVLHLRDAGTNALMLNQTVNLSAGAVYTLPGVSNGTYNLYIMGTCRFMRKKLSGLVVNDASLSNQDATLKNGDVNTSNSVNILDQSAMAVAHGTQPGDPAWNVCADFDGNGIVEAGVGQPDKLIMTAFWFQSGDAEP